MAVVTAAFDRYKIWNYSAYQQTGYFDILVYCYQGTTLVGRMEFHKDTATDAALASRIVNGQPFVLYRTSRFADIYQLLLHDKPLSLTVNDANGIGMVSTDEPEWVGQEE